MVDLACRYLDFDLRNPIIVGSSGLTDSIEKIKMLDKIGVGAVVLKTLFEEEIDYCEGRIIDMEFSSFPETSGYKQYFSRENSVDNYLRLIEDAKRETSMPVFASINCVAQGDWINSLKKIEAAGADALELNVFIFPDDKDFKADDYERVIFDIVSKVSYAVKLPLIVKLNPYFTNLLYIIDQLFYRGTQSVVLFDRMFHPDIDLDTLELKKADLMSNPYDYFQTLRWISIVSTRISRVEIVASSGVHDSEAAIKLLLAGAHAIMICSVLYKNGLDYIGEICNGIKIWMENKGFERIEQFQGQLNYSIVRDPFLYERSQFVNYFSL
jgi:dihydroorotate dehydrogenase (fumarate)